MDLWEAKKEVFVAHRCLPLCSTTDKAKGLRWKRGGRKKSGRLFFEDFRIPLDDHFQLYHKAKRKATIFLDLLKNTSRAGSATVFYL
jgi:hypothetical protein